MEEEIDLRPYIAALLHAWRWIIGTALLAALMIFGLSLRLPNIYEARSAVAIVRSRTDVSFDPQIQTEEDMLGSRDVRSRLEGLVALATSDGVAAEVLVNVKQYLSDDKQNVSDLLKMVAVSNTGDIIFISVSHPNPEAAARIANVWAQVYESQVNALYGSGANSELSVLATQLETASTKYEDAQATFEAFVGNNKITLLQNEIAAQEDVLASYQSARNKIQSNPIDFQVNTRQEVLVNYYTDLGNSELWLADAQSLREQVAAGVGSPAANLGNALALIDLRSRIFGGTSDSFLLQIDLVEGSFNPVLVSDVDVIIDVLETRREETQAAIETLSISFASVEPEELTIDDDHPISQRIVELNTNLLGLRAELTTQLTEERELTQARDLAWDTYQTLVRKQKEVEIASDAVGTEVRIAGLSTAPSSDDPVGPNRLTNAILAGIVSCMIAVFVVLVIQWWGDNSGGIETAVTPEEI